MKSRITVVAAAIVKDGKLLALRRADGNEEVIHKFEFVGGKVEEGETPEHALIRECKEELSIDVEVVELLNTIEYDYPNTSVCLSVYFVKMLSENYKLSVHEEDRWIDFSELESVEWAPADKQFIRSLKKGYVKIAEAKTEEDFKSIYSIAKEVMHETYDASITAEKVDYIIEKNLTQSAICEKIENSGYKYKLICLNGEAAGFYAVCPAKNSGFGLSEGTFLSKMYVKKFARGKRITSKIISSLGRPVYLTVKKDNNVAVNVYKHNGFKILQSITNDWGDGLVCDDFLMILSK